MLMCGIPEITLLGTPADWDLLDAKVNKLHEFGPDCSKWANMLKPITGAMGRAARGDIPLDFWTTICDYRSGGSGPSYLSGWITAFCVFNDKGQWQGGDGEGYPRIDFDDVPTGYATVPMIVDDNGQRYDTVLIAGHAAYTAAAEKNTIQPMLSWALFTTTASASGVAGSEEDDD